jgi:protein O-GlcNAc transferase
MPKSVNRLSTAQQLDSAKRLFAEGKYPEAIACCETVLQSSPQHFAALSILGNCFRRMGRLAEATRCLEQALGVNPASSETLYSLGLASLQGALFTDAIGYFDRAIAARATPFPEAGFNKGIALAESGQIEPALDCFAAVRLASPPSAVVLYNEGLALGKLGRHSEGLACYEEALLMEPNSPELLLNHGVTLNCLGRYADALKSLDLAISLDGHFLQAHINRIFVLLNLERNEDALACSEQATTLWPDSPDALAAKALALNQLKRFEQALESSDQALSRRPGHAAALNQRGIALHQMRRFQEALQSFDSVRPHETKDVAVICNRSLVLADLGRFGEALAGFEQALALSPKEARLLNNVANTYLELSRHEEAIGYFERLVAADPDYTNALGSLTHARMHLCDWSGWEENVEAIRRKLAVGRPCVDPFQWLAMSDDPAEHLLASRLHARQFDLPASAPARLRAAAGAQRIRVAYISADYREHAVSYLIAGLFECHDKSRFETCAISIGPQNTSSIRKRLEAAVDRFIDAGQMSDHDLAGLLRSQNIDIAVDLLGYTKDARSRLYAHRAAPIQVNYLGYPGTMGCTSIDYILADRKLIGLEDRQFYQEKVVCLPHTYQATDSKRPISMRVPTRTEAALPENQFVFASFSSSFKIIPDIFGIWMRLLMARPGSVLWLLDASAAQKKNLRAQARARGVDGSRLIFAPKVEVSAHLARLGLADLCLDTFPYGGHTTTSDALWAGVPVVTCRGRSFAARVASSLLHAIGLPDLVTQSLQEYEELASRLAREPEQLHALRAKLAEHRLGYPLFDTASFTRHLEAAYAEMWRRYLDNAPPDHFSVPA